MQQADRVGVRVVRAERVRAHEFGEPAGLVSLRAAHGPHLVEDDRHAGIGDLPRGFRTREAAADDVDGVERDHRPAISEAARWDQPFRASAQGNRLRWEWDSGTGFAVLHGPPCDERGWL